MICREAGSRIADTVFEQLFSQVLKVGIAVVVVVVVVIFYLKLLCNYAIDNIGLLVVPLMHCTTSFGDVSLSLRNRTFIPKSHFWLKFIEIINAKHVLPRKNLKQNV